MHLRQLPARPLGPPGHGPAPVALREGDLVPGLRRHGGAAGPARYHVHARVVRPGELRQHHLGAGGGRGPSVRLGRLAPRGGQVRWQASAGQAHAAHGPGRREGGRARAGRGHGRSVPPHGGGPGRPHRPLQGQGDAAGRPPADPALHRGHGPRGAERPPARGLRGVRRGERQRPEVLRARGDAGRGSARGRHGAPGAAREISRQQGRRDQRRGHAAARGGLEGPRGGDRAAAGIWREPELPQGRWRHPDLPARPDGECGDLRGAPPGQGRREPVPRGRGLSAAHGRAAGPPEGGRLPAPRGGGPEPPEQERQHAAARRSQARGGQAGAAGGRCGGA
mmetsp:Transcript_48171/g.127763  ORF Transcript_48171/g.127763 Transcript_48171/m.127763 type:complete len:337 (-) Transcript_48171:36-1046(-)